MPTNYPDGLDNFVNPTPANNLNTPIVLHSDEHSNENDAIEALEHWVGISGSLEPASLEYRLNHIVFNAGSSIVAWDEGIVVGTGTVLNFVGGPVDVTISGSVIQVFITGTQGATGPQGPSGSPGSQGPQGPQGPTGAMGPQGFEGATGATGPQGIQGPIGPSGSQGVQGVEGATGSQGLPGANGGGGMVWDDGVPIGTGTIFNFGNELSASISGSVVQVDATGALAYLAIDGTRLTTYSASGGQFIVISNTLDPPISYGSMFVDDASIVVTITGVGLYHQVLTGLSGSFSSNDFTFQNGRELKATITGTYHATWSMSFSSATNNEIIDATIMINGVHQSNCEGSAEGINSGKPVGVSGAGFIRLVPNDLVSFAVENDTAAHNITVTHANLAIMRVT